jgi:nitronate monooxygenase
LPVADKTKMNFASGGNAPAKAWKDIWGAGQSVSGIHEVQTVASLVSRLEAEYQSALAALAGPQCY